MRTRVGWCYDPLFLEHRQEGHPERPERLERLIAVLDRTGLLSRLEPIEPMPVAETLLERVHSPEQIRIVRELADGIGGAVEEDLSAASIDADTFVVPESDRAARLAAGGAAACVDAVFEGRVKRAFAALRPPGHHATDTNSMGFCLFNNVAVAARRAQDLGAERVVIMDWDVHHGNGTQDIFYEDGSVVFISTHQYPLYPGTGRPEEIGAGRGKGGTINVPLPPGTGDDGMMHVFDELVVPCVRRANPDLVLISAGFDAHVRDPLAQLSMSAGGFHMLARRLIDVAEEVCEGRVVVCLEGGYDLDAIAWSGAATIAALLDDEAPPADPLDTPTGAEHDIHPLVDALRELHGIG